MDRPIVHALMDAACEPFQTVLEEVFSEVRRQGVPGNSLPMERCYTPTAGAAGPGGGKRNRKRAPAVLSPLSFRSPERNASASWPQSKISAPSVLGSVTSVVN